MRAGLPLAIRAEQALLGAVLLDPAGQGHLLDLIATEDMTRPYHGQVLAAMQRVRGRGTVPAPLVVHEEVTKDPDMPRGLSCDGVPLADLMEAAPRSDHAPAYAAMVIGSGVRRHLWLVAGRMTQAAETGDLESALRMTDRARQQLERCRVRWEGLPVQLRREMPAPDSNQAWYDQIARRAYRVRDAADLANGVGPFAIARAREVHRRGLLAQIDRAGRDIQADASEPAVSTGGFLGAAHGRLARLRPEAESQPSRRGQARSPVLARDHSNVAAPPRVPAPRQPGPEAVP